MSPSFSQETDIINPTGITSFLPQQQQPSESSFSGPLNFSSLPASSSSPLNNSFTIDFTSFTTDTFQQPWLPSPPPHQPQASSLNNNSNNSNNSALEDFVLYPAPPAPAPRPQPQHRDSRALAASSTAPKPSALQPFLAQNNPRRHSFSLQLQRHLQQQQFSGSPVLDPRVTKLARSHSYWSHPNVKHSPHHHAVSSYSPNNRPPVPTFHAGTSDLSTIEKKKQHMLLYRRNMSTPNFAGNYLSETRHPASATHTIPLDPDAELFGLPSTGLNTGMGSPLDLGQLPLGPEADSAFSPVAPTGTISPKDLMFDGSVPPSGTFTDLSTPPYDSPATFSNVFDAHFDVAAALAEAEKKPEPMSPAPKRLSSAKASPIPATGTIKHSSVSGISRARKELSPVDFDPSDPVAAKRARNTEAARKSRAKKLERQANAERTISDLRQQIADRDETIAKLQAQLRIQEKFQ
ncbi:Cross-pathway control protein A [Penicillium citrinum]|uniref:Cross-pathway control protein A n=1 Tax=Penicillium citrinum TaxID=5077 RepID=A0A9W9NKL2_PENCI|nr:Cross-pathway control protein A [Penicillium citrinum]KAJ5221680.1 Cross-pathway control protein A [Penicillium citrinum]